MRGRNILFLVLAIALLRCVEAPAEPLYRLEDLGTLGGAFSRALAVNAAGDVVGEAETAGGQTHAFLWTRASGLKDLGTLGGAISRAFAVNAKQDVVGEAEDAAGIMHAFLWSSGAGMKRLPAPADALASHADGINDTGLIVGAVETAEGARPVYWDETGCHPLRQDEHVLGSCHAVGESGWIAGQIQFGRSHSNAFSSVAFSAACLSTGCLVRTVSPRNADFSASSSAYDIAPDGVIVGYLENSPGEPRACRVLPDAAPEFIDTLNSRHSCAYGINKGGDVVGVFTLEEGQDDRAFLWRGGAMMDLNDLIDQEGDGWLVIDARGINDESVIACRAAFSGRERAARLVPAGMRELPRVTLHAPAPFARCEPGAPVRLAAAASSGKGIVRVVFLSNGQTIATDKEPPYAVDWTPRGPGVYEIIARAVDAASQVRTSGRSLVEVLPPNKPPETWMARPASNLQVRAGQEMELSAAAADNDGAIRSLALFVDGRAVTSAPAAEYLAWKWVVPSGETNGAPHVLFSVACDDRGACVTSATINVTGEAPADAVTLPPASTP